MKRGIKTLLVAGALTALAGMNGVAQSGLAIRAKVPFEFSVWNTRLAAGEYMVTRDLARNAIRIISVDTGAGLTIQHRSAMRNTTGSRYALVFHKYGDQHFLREIWSGDSAEGTRLPVSPAEKELITAQAPVKATLKATSAL